MQFMKLEQKDRDAYLCSLEEMPTLLEATFSGLPSGLLYKNGPAGEFSPIEQVWHLADLEEEGFSARIQALLNGTAQNMPGFDGDKVAMARNYKSLSFQAGIEKFRKARQKNIRTLQAVDDVSWKKEGVLEGVGEVTLCDMPSFLYQHDQAHKKEIEAWKITFAP